MGKSLDFVVCEIIVGSYYVVFFYLDGMIDMQKIQDNVICLLQEIFVEELSLFFLKDSVFDVGEVSFFDNIEDVLEQILLGGFFLLIDGMGEGLVVFIFGWEECSIMELKMQFVI